MPKNKASLVYSSKSGSICPECEKPLDACFCNPSANPKDGLNTVRLSLTSKGRKGKSVTLIKGLRMNPSELKAYAGKLKKKTGTGGSLKDGVVEIQGDYREKVAEILRKDGWEVKLNS
jgi:Translation initiation factor 1 (eIF-1/SUI1) and related proteins